MRIIKIIIFVITLLISIAICEEECIPFEYPKEGTSCLNNDNEVLIPTTFPSCLIDEDVSEKYYDIISNIYNSETFERNPSTFSMEFFKKDSYLNFTLVSIKGGINNYIGYILNRKDGSSEIIEMWNLRSSYRTSGCISYGDTIQIGPFDEGDKIAFYIRCDTLDDNYCDPNIIVCSDPSFHDECKQHPDDYEIINFLSVFPYYDMTTQKFMIGFEDSYTSFSDSSYNDIILAFSLSSTIEVPSYPVYLGIDDDDNVINLICNLSDPFDVIEWSSASFALYKGNGESSSSMIRYGWFTPSKRDFKDFISENPSFIGNKCIYLFDIHNDAIISSHGCNKDDHDVYLSTESCITIPSDVYLLFQKGERIFGPSSRCVNSCSIDNDIELKDGDTIYFDNAVVYLTGNLTIQNGSTIEIQGESTKIIIAGDGVLVVNGGNLKYHVSENQLERLDGYNKSIASGNIEYNSEMNVNLVLPDKSDKKIVGDIEYGGKNLYLVFIIEKTIFPWWGILLICITIVIVFAGIIVVALRSSKFRSKFLPFR